jgi:hypothetical protein
MTEGIVKTKLIVKGVAKLRNRIDKNRRSKAKGKEATHPLNKLDRIISHGIFPSR